jgi:hypothetical protein
VHVGSPAISAYKPQADRNARVGEQLRRQRNDAVNNAGLDERFPDGDLAPSIQLTRDTIASWAALGGRAGGELA